MASAAAEVAEASKSAMPASAPVNSREQPYFMQVDPRGQPAVMVLGFAEPCLEMLAPCLQGLKLCIRDQNSSTINHAEHHHLCKYLENQFITINND